MLYGFFFFFLIAQVSPAQPAPHAFGSEPLALSRRDTQFWIQKPSSTQDASKTQTVGSVYQIPSDHHCRISSRTKFVMTENSLKAIKDAYMVCHMEPQIVFGNWRIIEYGKTLTVPHLGWKKWTKHNQMSYWVKCSGFYNAAMNLARGEYIGWMQRLEREFRKSYKKQVFVNCEIWIGFYTSRNIKVAFVKPDLPWKKGTFLDAVWCSNKDKKIHSLWLSFLR